MLALLTDALNVYQKGALSKSSRPRRLFVDAERWILADQTNSGGFSFVTVCDALGINADLLRRRIIEWKHAVSAERRACSASRIRLKITPRTRHAKNRAKVPKAAAPA